ncbi:hypothetical protein FGIG_04466 [Fasciola gigantica]|uniref:Uncharacterized protein n=1 Tax=Fasciola gigantica TaxID=46835 RepID=A0A504Z0M8_FASGI|nr:hypothetical protein FGIG_04466 [Fasciola gigantica]
MKYLAKEVEMYKRKLLKGSNGVEIARLAESLERKPNDNTDDGIETEKLSRIEHCVEECCSLVNYTSNKETHPFVILDPKTSDFERQLHRASLLVIADVGGLRFVSQTTLASKW